MSSSMRSLCAALLMLLAQPAFANQINAIISQYSAAEFASAVVRFKQRHPGITVAARTPEQLSEMNDVEAAEWLASGDVLLVVGVFGAEVDRLHRLLQRPVPADRVIMHSDQSLVAMSRIDGQPVFSDAEHATRLGAEKPGEDLVSWARQLGDANPGQASWIEARSYWLGGGSENIARLLGWLSDRGGATEVLPPSLVLRCVSTRMAASPIPPGWPGGARRWLPWSTMGEQTAEAMPISTMHCARRCSSATSPASASSPPGAKVRYRRCAGSRVPNTHRWPPSSCCRTSCLAAVKAASRRPIC